MAAFNFPNSPSTNDLHTENGVTFKWNGTIWLRIGNTYTDISTLNVTGISTLTGGINVGTAGTISSAGNITLDKPGAGIITATKYYGDGSTLSNVTSTTINNNANNRIITGSGTANTLNGESTLTYDGNNLTQTIDADTEGFRQTAAGNHYVKNIVDANRSGAGAAILAFHANWNGKDVSAIKFRTGADTSNKDDGHICFETSSANNIGERLRIDSAGRILIGTTTPSNVHSDADDVVIGNTSASLKGLSILTSTSGYATLNFTDGAGDKNQGMVAYNHSNDTLNFSTSSSKRFVINSSGYIGIGEFNNISQKVHIREDSNPQHYMMYLQNRYSGVNSSSLIALSCGGVDFSDNRYGYIGAKISGSSENGTHLLFATNPNGGSAAVRLFIQDDGKIGVNRTANMTTWFDINHGSTSSPETNLMLSGSGITAGGGTGIFLKSSSNTTLNRYGTRIHSIREAANNGASSLVISNELLDASGLDEVLRINSNGEMGLGVIPKAWKTGSDFRALQVGTGLAVVGRGSGDEDRGGISVNHYINTSDTAKYIAGGHANYLYMNDGRYDFRTAASGSADGTISWTTPLQITASGLVGINQNPQVSKLEITHAGTNTPLNQIELNTSHVTDGGGSGIFFKNSGATGSSHTNRYGTRLHTVRGGNGASTFKISNEKTSGAGLVEALRIDPEQRVFKPQQPRFCIVGGNNLYNNSESNIWNNTHAYAPSSSVNGGYGTSVQCNVGNHYNTSNGRWTVPIAGAYYFFFYGTTGSNHSHFVYITKNGSSIANDLGLEYSQGEYHQNFAGSYLINCASGDYMNFYRRGSGYNFYSLVWGGWLVA